ncbi:50S ribosomal protein L29 [Patescibacteria group bacterium]|nr:50S ribosomal protein L29 [Patescibacteria group bacterium]
MKQKDLDDLKNKTVEELEAMAAKTRTEIIKTKMELSMRHSKNTNLAKNLKKNLAQILTIRKELEHANV